MYAICSMYKFAIVFSCLFGGKGTRVEVTSNRKKANALSYKIEILQNKKNLLQRYAFWRVHVDQAIKIFSLEHEPEETQELW